MQTLTAQMTHRPARPDRRAGPSRGHLHHHPDRLFRGRRGLLGGQVPGRDGRVRRARRQRLLPLLAAADRLHGRRDRRPDPRQRRPRLGHDLHRAPDRQHRIRRRLRPCRLWRHLLRPRHRPDPGGGWPFFDRAVDDPWFDADDAAAGSAPARARLRHVAAVAVALAARRSLWSTAGRRGRRARGAGRIALPDVPGWQRVPAARAAPGSRISPAPTAFASAIIATRRGGRSTSPSSFSPGRARAASWSATARARSRRTAPGRGPPTPRRRRTAARNGSPRTGWNARSSASTGSATS